MELREYQEECIGIIDNLQSGAYLVQMPTGCGKTVTFTSIKRKGRVLILSHREELVKQPVKYYNCPVGIEMASAESSGEEVVSASVMSLKNRLGKFSPNDFDIIIIDEAHHAASASYKKIINYFKPRLLLGFTATPNRSDGVRLDDVFSKIIFERDLRWAVKNGFLADINCLRVNIGYDISKVAMRLGDFSTAELEDVMNKDVINKAVAKAYREYARGQTIIFAASVKHAQSIAAEIPGSLAVTAETGDRGEIIKRFSEKKIPVIVNCMVFSEGTDIPEIETVIIARPTASSSLYTQMVGRGLRLCPGKDKLRLIDLVGVTGKVNLCTAPSLLGVDISGVPEARRDEIQGDLFALPEIVKGASDCPESWILNVEMVKIWAKEQEYDTHGVNYFRLPDGDMTVNLPGKKIVIPAPDVLGETTLNGERVGMQQASQIIQRTTHESGGKKKCEEALNLKIR